MARILLSKVVDSLVPRARDVRSCHVDRARRGPRQPEVDMLRFHIILAAALLMPLGCNAACQGDFLPRPSNGFAAVGDDSGSHSSGGDRAVMSEPDSAPAPSPGPSPANTPTRS